MQTRGQADAHDFAEQLPVKAKAEGADGVVRIGAVDVGKTEQP